MELENIISSEVSQAQKAKNHTFSLICGPKTNAVIILLDMGRMHTGGIGKGKEMLNMKVFDVATVEELIK
jgi:hypothetical protein